MTTCTMNHFLEAVKPWLDQDYIRSVQLRADGAFILNFADNVKNIYHIEDCESGQLAEILANFRQKGIPVLE